MVRGGAGFLGSFVVAQLRARGAQEIIVPRHADYDLVQQSAIQQLLADDKRAKKARPARNDDAFITPK
ncbi:MAG: hypothetical protein AAF639_36140 [Chloroflexota bacterium]